MFLVINFTSKFDFDFITNFYFEMNSSSQVLTLFSLAYLSISRANRVKVSLMISFIFRVRIGCEKKVFPLK